MAGSPDPSQSVVSAAPVAASGNVTVQVRHAPSFQSNYFQTNAFQTAQFSQAAFQQCAFSHEGFQTDECISNGRSGYWRLFFTNMQEEALKKRDEKTNGDSGKLATPEVVASKSKKQPKPVTPKKREPSKVAPKAPVIPFRRLPTKLEPNAFDMLAELPPLMVESYLLSLSSRVIINLDDERIQRRKKKRKLAAFLLLAA